MYDVIIIGSGIGGLASGVILAREGMRVCVLEKHFQIGGCLQTFTRDGCVFDTGMHYIGSTGEGQIVDRLLRYLNVRNKITLRDLDEGCFDRVNLPGDDTDYDFAIGYPRFIDTLCEHFPNERAAIERYADKLREITGSLDMYNLRDQGSFDLINSGYLTLSASDYIDSLTTDEKLRKILAATNPLYSGVRGVSPIYVHAAITNSFIEGASRIVGGGDTLASALVEELRANGGEIHTRKEVREFLSKDGIPYAVKTVEGEVFEGKNFISNVHPVKTLEMIDSPLIRRTYRSRINSLEETKSTFVAYVTFKEKSFRYMNYNYYCYETDDVWSGGDYDEVSWPKGLMLITPASADTGEYADCAMVMTYMNWDEVSRWENTTVGHRGDEYEEFKRKKAEKLFASVERRFPGFRSSVKNFYTSTPLTYRDYTGTHKGSLYGFLKDCRNPLNTYVPPRTKVPNLFLVGQNINMHGVLGVLICSILTCGELIGVNEIVRKVRDAK
ncbi:MAG TPA: NAD(P)/FAD-dependent oxidoreductase [Spirochaetota bacterium]|nr:NAD(P)/FAD-dependent oxidoreductase [Spirochaetota bacterium]